MTDPRSIESALAEASRARAGGDPGSARRVLEQAVRLQPRHPGALALLADVLRDLGERDLSLARLRDAAEAAGQDPRLWRLLVGELLRAGRKSRARATAAKAPLRPADRKALIALAEAGADPARTGPHPDADDAGRLHRLLDAGRLDEARAFADARLAEDPASAARLNLRGVVALAANDPAGAEPFFRAALARDPGHVGAAGNLGLALGIAGRAPEAAAILSDALTRDPGNLRMRINLSGALLELGRATDALHEIAKALEQFPDDPAALAVKAHALVMERRFAEARALLQGMASRQGAAFALAHLLVTVLAETDGAEAAIAFAARRAAPTSETLRRLATVKAEAGRIDEAKDDLRAAARLDPGNTPAFRDFALISAWTADEPMLALLEAQATAGPARAQDRAALNYALGRARADLGDPRAAFAAFVRANAAEELLIAPSQRAARPSAADVARRFTPARIAELAAAGDDSVAPVFIIGMPRSGSTLTEQILAAHPGVAALGEYSVVLPLFLRSEDPSPADIAAAARAGAGALTRAAGPGRRPVDKNLLNFAVLGLLAAAFPCARFLHTTRDPRDTCLSIFTNPLDPVQHPYAVNLERMADFYVQYHRLMTHWKGAVGGRILDLRYEGLVADPAPRIRAMLDWLDLPWHDACLRPEAADRRVQTLSVGQVRGGITAASVGRWEAYAEELRPLTDILEREGILP